MFTSSVGARLSFSDPNLDIITAPHAATTANTMLAPPLRFARSSAALPLVLRIRCYIGWGLLRRRPVRHLCREDETRAAGVFLVVEAVSLLLLPMRLRTVLLLLRRKIDKVQDLGCGCQRRWMNSASRHWAVRHFLTSGQAIPAVRRTEPLAARGGFLRHRAGMPPPVGGCLRMQCCVPRLSRFRALRVTAMEVALAMVAPMAVVATATA